MAVLPYCPIENKIALKSEMREIITRESCRQRRSPKGEWGYVVQLSLEEREEHLEIQSSNHMPRSGGLSYWWPIIPFFKYREGFLNIPHVVNCVANKLTILISLERLLISPNQSLALSPAQLLLLVSIDDRLIASLVQIAILPCFPVKTIFYPHHEFSESYNNDEKVYNVGSRKPIKCWIKIILEYEDGEENSFLLATPALSSYYTLDV